MQDDDDDDVDKVDDDQAAKSPEREDEHFIEVCGEREKEGGGEVERAFFLLLLHLLLPGEYCDAVGNVCYAFEGTPGTTEPRTGQRIPPIRDPERWSVRASKPAKDRRKGGSERASNRSWGNASSRKKRKEEIFIGTGGRDS